MNRKLGFILILFASVTACSFIYFFTRLSVLETKFGSLSNPVPNNVSKVSDVANSESLGEDACGETCPAEIKNEVTKAIAKISPAVEKVTTKTITVKPGGTTYIPMGSSYESTSTDWYTLNDTATYIDLVNDYGEDATVSWEASLKVDHGNGQAFVRLWDDTNKIAVNGSEMSTINNADYKLVTTGIIPFWRGRNLYKVQIKSLNSFVVSYTGGKIRISY